MNALQLTTPLRHCVCIAALALLASMASGLVTAAPGGESRAGPRLERERLMAERTRLEANFADEQRRCGERFAVTACVNDVRQRQRLALAPLRERELQINAAERRQSAVDRRAAIAAKQQEIQQRPAASAPDLRVRDGPDQPAMAASRAARPLSNAAARKAEIEAQAATRSAAAAQRRAVAELAQMRIAARLADRAAKGKASAPLPLPLSKEASSLREPGAASASRR